MTPDFNTARVEDSRFFIPELQAKPDESDNGTRHTEEVATTTRCGRIFDPRLKVVTQGFFG